MKYEIRLTPAGHETGLVGSATGASFDHTIQFHVMSYNQAMASDESDQWDKSVIHEHGTFKKYKVWKKVYKSKVYIDTKVLSST
eukprot:14717636-Ditylum_brightwellii.AAC.1